MRTQKELQELARLIKDYLNDNETIYEFLRNIIEGAILNGDIEDMPENLNENETYILSNSIFAKFSIDNEGMKFMLDLKKGDK